MRKYQEWQETQTYFQHLSQLSRIRIRKPAFTPTNKLRQDRTRKFMHTDPPKSMELSRINNLSPEKPDEQFLPLNLVPKDMRSALKNTLKLQRTMPLKDKEIVL